jgi:1,4-alpha-glucan branching enzyme
MLKKTPVQGSDRVSVTFEMTPDNDARSVHVAGDFNGWDPAATPLKQRKDGTWATTVRLQRKRAYAYRFVVNGNRWLTDEQADAQVPNEHGSTNSVVDLK